MSEEARRIARATLPEGLRPETLAVRTALPPSQHCENSEGLFLTSAYVQPDAATSAQRFADAPKLGPLQKEALDLFDRGQLNLVIDVCRRSGSLSEAGRQLFAVSRLQKSQANDADRLRKYLARFGLEWSRVSRGEAV